MSLFAPSLIDLNHNSNRNINYITERQGFLSDLIRYQLARPPERPHQKFVCSLLTLLISSLPMRTVIS